MKRKLVLFLFVTSALCWHVSYAGEKQTRLLSLEDVLFYAQQKDPQLKTLSFSLKETVRSKKNLYRSLFPSVSTSFSTTNSLSIGEADTRNYAVGLTLEQVLYDQLSTPIKLKNFGITLEEARLKIDEREKAIEQKAVDLYLNILIGEEKLKNKRVELELYTKLLELMRQEHRLGTKTMLDVIDTERELLEAELALEELSARREILYKDLMNLIGFQTDVHTLVLKDDLNHILVSVLSLKGVESFDSLYNQMQWLMQRYLDKDRLYSMARDNNFEIRKKRLALRQNSLKKKLLSIQFLENVSLSYKLGFTGERFFPANTTHTIAVNFLLDFGILSSEVSVSETTSESTKTRAQEAESELLESLDPLGAGRALRIEAYTAAKELEEIEKTLLKSIEVWIIKMESLRKTYAIQQKQKTIFAKNEELLETKLRLGEIKKVDYTEFLIKKNEFLIELEETKYNFISLIWELEDILTSKITEIAG